MARAASKAQPAHAAKHGIPPQSQRAAQPVRWYVAGATALVVVAIVAYSLLSGGGTSGAGAGATVGEVIETAAGMPRAPAMLAAGTAAPDLRWTAGGMDGSVAGSRGSPLILEFFATWCPHCQRESPVLSGVYDRYRPRRLRVIGVSASPTGQNQRSAVSAADIASYAQKYDGRFPLLLDRNLVGAQRYGVTGFPTIYIIDRQGIIRYAFSGEVPEATLTDAVERLLAG